MWNESSKGNLRRCLDSITRICDHTYIYDDGSTDDSVAVASSYKNVSVMPCAVNDFANEIGHKAYLLQNILEARASHILWLDVDEVFEKRAEEGALRELASNMTCDAYTFPQVNLWRSERYFRTDNQYGDGIFTRLWRNNGSLHYDIKSGLHHRQYPLGIDSVKDSDLLVIHYGFADDKNLLDKYNTYKSHGQDGWALDRLINESTLTLGKTLPAWLGREPEGRFVEYMKPLRSLL